MRAMASMAATDARRVLLFGLSANPPTGAQGHMGILSHCCRLPARRGDGGAAAAASATAFDEVWLLPVFQHIYTSKRRLAPFRDRLAMLQLAVDDVLGPNEGARPLADCVAVDGAKVVVSEYERELFEHVAQSTGEAQPRIGSIDLVTFLLDKHPDTRFTLLVGADAYADLIAGKWKRGDELQRLVDLLVVDRVGVWAPSRAPPPQEQVTDRVAFLNVPTLNDGSSTKARELTDEEELASYVSPSVVAYMKRHKLYAFAEDEEAE